MRSCIILICLILTACQEEAADKSKANARKPPQVLPKGFYDYKLPEAAPQPPPPPPEVQPEPEPLPADIAFPDPKPLLREQQARALRGLRQYRVNQILANQDRVQKESSDKLKLEDEDYQQWPDATFAESRSTMPVDRSRILTEDMRIPAILEDAINSHNAGRIIALVERDILSPNGRYILLPAYSKIICKYKPLQEAGDSRLEVRCHRIIRPDGVSIALHDALAADQSGRSGLVGDIDHRIADRYGAAFLIAGISALAQAGANVAKNQAMNASANQLSQNIGQITADVIERNMDLAPIINIPAGTRIQILPTTDIILRHPDEKRKKLKEQARAAAEGGQVQTTAAPEQHRSFFNEVPQP